MIGICEAMIYSQKAGLDQTQIINLLQKGSAGSTLLKGFGAKLVARDFKPGFFVDLFVKDLGIALEESQRMGIKLPGTTRAC